MPPGFQVSLVVKNPPTNAGDMWDAGLIPGLGRSSGGQHGKPALRPASPTPAQYSCLENPHRQKSLADYSPWGCRVRHDWSNLAATAVLPLKCYSTLKKELNKCRSFMVSTGKENYWRGTWTTWACCLQNLLFHWGLSNFCCGYPQRGQWFLFTGPILCSPCTAEAVWNT